MQLYHFSRHILYSIILSIIACQLIVCSQKGAERKAAATTKSAEMTDAKSSDTEEKDYWTDTIIGSIYVRIHNRITTKGEISPTDPVVWDGPVEIGKEPKSFSCKIDSLWIIDSLATGPSLNLLLVKSYSGSKNRIDLIDVDSCKIVSSKIF